MGFKDRIYYISFFTLAFIVKKFPFRDFLLNILAKAAYYIDKRHRRYAIINLTNALRISQKEAKKITKEVYKNLIFNLADFIQNQNTTKEAILKKVEFKNEHFLQNLPKDKPILFMTAHYGNWELIPLAIAAKFNIPLSVIGRPLESAVMDEILKKNREQFNIELIPKRRAMKKIVSAISQGRAVGILPDQHTTDREGIEIEFFSLKAMHNPALSLLSRKYNTPILPAFITTSNHKRYTITFYEPIEPIISDNEKEDIKRLTQAQADITQKVIEKKPQEWFWLHKRWKKALKYD
jgi:KDO2-lipid IV(A) lauroyltransferase